MPWRPEELCCSPLDSLQIWQLTLPNNEHTPTRFAKLHIVVLISNYVAFEFIVPKVSIRCGQASKMAILMRMPETTMDEDHLAPAGEHQVGFARKRLAVQSVAVTHPVE